MMDQKLDVNLAEREWFSLNDLAAVYRASVVEVERWIEKDVNMADYNHEQNDYGTISIHESSWEQFCEDFWFRNVPR